MNNEISVVDAHKIDRTKWNRCVDKSPNGLIYALTEYLDHMTEQWAGIVINDYEAVLPVPWKKKFGIKYAYSVPFIQQLGLFSGDQRNIDDAVMEAIFSVCSYGEYYFNYANNVSGGVARINYVLPLKPLDELMKTFSDDAQQIIKKTLSANLVYGHAELAEAIDTSRKLYGGRVANISSGDYQNFTELCKVLSTQNAVIARKATEENGNMLAIILLLKYRNRLYNIVNATTPGGRKLKANYFLLANVWKEFDTTNLLFDFEGSELPGVKKFYEKFSPKNQPYFSLRFNHLRFPANIFKK
jgi:hypothetical protein